MKRKIYTVDAFTTEKFKGNPAGVCFADKDMPGKEMQLIATEMNIAETAFFFKEGEIYNLRWFTPECEVDLCGHATLSTAHIIWETGIEDKNKKLSFSTRSGILTAEFQNGKIKIDLPAMPSVETSPTEIIMNSLGDPKAIYTGRTKYNFIVELENESALMDIKPDFEKIKSQSEFYGCIITAKSDNDKYDFVSRYFAPAKGINEDPVTGSAHCTLAVYWKNKLKKEGNLKAYQASKRGGELEIEVSGERVFIYGDAVTFLAGELI
ncbi:PhzF family phenazine biosynthesis protein [soil metagenome]